MLARMLVALGLVLGLLGGITWLLKKYGARLGLPVHIKPGHARLQMVEVRPLDARHRLVLVRRDQVEHLLVLGGTQPVVIETAITSSSSPSLSVQHTNEK
jgi:flagellar protein FliO/FliZ